jgi:hypothetical protein
MQVKKKLITEMKIFPFFSGGLFSFFLLFLTVFGCGKAGSLLEDMQKQKINHTHLSHSGAISPGRRHSFTMSSIVAYDMFQVPNIGVFLASLLIFLIKRVISNPSNTFPELSHPLKPVERLRMQVLLIELTGNFLMFFRL